MLLKIWSNCSRLIAVVFSHKFIELKFCSSNEFVQELSHYVLSVWAVVFPVAAARTWNSLPPSVTASQSLQTFRKRLKTELFQRSYVTASLP